MRAVPVMGIGEQLLQALPVLNRQGAAARKEIPLPQHSRLGLLSQLFLHPRHGQGHRPPAVDGGQPVDAHADQEQRQGLVGMGLLTSANNRHGVIMPQGRGGRHAAI